MILVVDNYDSFVHNLARYLQRLGQQTVVVRADAIDTADVRELKPRALVLSPGPCTPQEAGNSLPLVRDLHRELPILGVCLGHQVIAEALGGRVIRASQPIHGRTSQIAHPGTRLFADLPNPMTVGRYHSLMVDERSLPSQLRATAWTGDGVLMAIEHVDLPVFGVQFHPEAILTECGYELLANFLRLAGLDPAADMESLAAAELLPRKAELRPLPTAPVTF